MIHIHYLVHFFKVLLVRWPRRICRFPRLLISILGLPYALRQAGFFTGLFLLVALCGVTDWTIRLIVINAKLSGGHSYIDIMTHCFGSSGRAAVSFFQFSFAFGGKFFRLLLHYSNSNFLSKACVPLASLLVIPYLKSFALHSQNFQ